MCAPLPLSCLRNVSTILSTVLDRDGKSRRSCLLLLTILFTVGSPHHFLYVGVIFLYFQSAEFLLVKGCSMWSMPCLHLWRQWSPFPFSQCGHHTHWCPCPWQITLVLAGEFAAGFISTAFSCGVLHLHSSGIEACDFLFLLFPFLSRQFWPSKLSLDCPWAPFLFWQSLRIDMSSSKFWSNSLVEQSDSRYIYIQITNPVPM